MGGLLNRLILVQATPYALSVDRFDGAILFFEELATSYAAVWNGLHALRYAGILDRIAGLIVGTPVDVKPVDGGPDDLRDVVLDVIGDRDIPVIGNVDIGHNPPNIPLPLGVRAEIDAESADDLAPRTSRELSDSSPQRDGEPRSLRQGCNAFRDPAISRDMRRARPSAHGTGPPAGGRFRRSAT